MCEQKNNQTSLNERNCLKENILGHMDNHANQHQKHHCACHSVHSCFDNDTPQYFLIQKSMIIRILASLAIFIIVLIFNPENLFQQPVIAWTVKFLVYATTFGISKQVIKQLKMVHPEMFEMDNAHMHRCAYWYMISDPRYGDNYFNNFNSGLSNVYSSASSAYSIAHSSSSSGSGSGGGFSGGGGGRRRRRRLRRSMKFRDARKVSFSY